jgi:hypothetical protein
VFAVLFGSLDVALRLGTGAGPGAGAGAGAARYSENTSQSSLIAAQSFLLGPDAEVAVVGSSIAARFKDDFFAEWGLPVIGLGLDGQGPATGMDLLDDAGRVPPMVAVELNRALYSDSGNEDVVFGAVAGARFDLARVSPAFRADARPTSLLFSQLKIRRDGSGEADAGRGLRPRMWKAEEAPEFDPDDLTIEQQRGADRVISSLERLTGAGACPVFFIAPDRGFAGPPEQAFAEHLSYLHDAWVVELRPLADQTELVYTDNIHLDVASARLVGHVLAQALLDLRATERGCRSN